MTASCQIPMIMWVILLAQIILLVSYLVSSALLLVLLCRRPRPREISHCPPESHP